jgi:hypothetical protein
VKPDPRVKLPQAAYEREFALAVKVQDALAQIAAAQAEAGKLLKALADRRSRNGTLRLQIEKLIADVSGLSDIPVPGTGRPGRETPPLRTDSLKSLSERFRGLEHAVDGADADPSADSLASYAALRKTLEKTLAAWQTAKQKDLASLNAALAAQHESGIVL